MGQKVRPTGFRTGVMIDWKSQWSASVKKEFPELLLEDRKIRAFINKEYRTALVSMVRIERTREKVIVYIHAAKVGSIIGQKGAKIDELTEKLKDMFNREIEVKTIEVHRPQTDPQILSREIADNLEKRQSFRRTLKRALEQAMESGARGVRIQMSGRLGGAEMARCESGMLGSIPLSTLRSRVEYGFSEASTPQGNIGIKVWVNNGDYLTEESGDGPNAQARKVSKKPARSGKR